MTAAETIRNDRKRRQMRSLIVAAVLCLANISAVAQMPQPPRMNGNAPQAGARMPAQSYPSGNQQQQRYPGGGAMMGPQRNPGEHLGQWMQQHGNLSPDQQQRALQREPGFNQLPQDTQQRILQRLNHLSSLPPQQRERMISGAEVMERMTPGQRQQVRGVMGQLGSLPPDRRQMVNRSFRELRSLPPAQRNQVLNSPAYHQQFSDEERGTLGNLLSVSPLLPPSH